MASRPLTKILGVTQTLAQLGVVRPDQVSALFSELRARFNDQLAACVDLMDVGVAQVDWLGRKSGVVSAITDHWLKPAPPDLKRTVGAALNELRAHVEQKIEERRT